MLRSIPTRRIGALRDIELYGSILGLTPPWTVANVELDVKKQQVVVQVDAGPGPFSCPECGTPAPLYDSRPRRWRHLDTMQFTTWIAADVPRVECATHGSSNCACRGPSRARSSRLCSNGWPLICCGSARSRERGG